MVKSRLKPKKNDFKSKNPESTRPNTLNLSGKRGTYNENTKRASWWARFLVNGRLDGSPICDQHGSEVVVPVLKRTYQNEPLFN